MFLFFKQKTAYEVRISDWSSDVCSSDLRVNHWPSAPRRWAGIAASSTPESTAWVCPASTTSSRLPVSTVISTSACEFAPSADRRSISPSLRNTVLTSMPLRAVNASSSRSEEHTSELQSLMRISYAVFCLKKKKKTQNH